jgi:hypothetical protein
VTPVRQPDAPGTKSVNRGILISAAFGAMLLLIAVTQASLYRQWINADSISYMDMGDAISRGEINRLINPYWSPLYPVLLGVLNAVWGPGPEWEFPAAHLVNFLCFFFAAAAFEYLMCSAWTILAADKSGTGAPLPRWAFLTIGYSFFLYASLGMVALMRTTPDMLMSGCLYLAAAFLVRVTGGHAETRYFVLLGISLALGYMTKAIMFPLGLLVLALTLLVSGTMRLRINRTAAATLGFAILAVPLVAAVSRSAHRLTFSEAGTLNYMFFVDRLDWYYQNRTGVSGHAVHPVATISQDPPAYSFAAPHNVTYSLWFDPYYWSEGLRPTVQVRTQVRILLEGLRGYARTLFQVAGVALTILLLFVLAGSRGALASLRPFWLVIVMSVALMAAYLLATPKIEDRYIGAPISIIGFMLLSGLLRAARLSRAALIIVVAVIALNLFSRTGINMLRDLRDNQDKAQRSEVDAAIGLKRMGFTPGMRVAAISPWISPGWARLTRLIIVADLPRELADKFWTLPADRQTKTLSAFGAAGSQAVVAWIGGRKDVPAGWQRLGSSPYVVYTPR